MDARFQIFDCRQMDEEMFGVDVDTSNEVSIESAESTKLYRKVTEDGSLFNILNGNFVEADRFVVVFRQIEHDEAFSCEPYRQRHNMTWMDIRPLSETQVVFRAIVQYSQFFREDLGFVSLDEQAEVWNVDLTGVPVEKKLEVLRSRFIQQQLQGDSQARQRIQDIIARTYNAKQGPRSS
ncbi:unnamed protein product [Aphanomyces euteiches]